VDAVQNARGKLMGGPKGNKHALKHGRYTAEAIARRKDLADVLRDAHALLGRMRKVAAKR
jgi:hypothetical protein